MWNLRERLVRFLTPKQGVTSSLSVLAARDGALVLEHVDPQGGRETVRYPIDGIRVNRREQSVEVSGYGEPVLTFSSHDPREVHRTYEAIQRALHARKGGGWRAAAIGAVVGVAVIVLGSHGKGASADAAAAPLPNVTPYAAIAAPAAAPATVPGVVPTQAKVSPEEATMLQGLQGIKMPGAGKSYFVFSDPNCPHCRKLDESIAQVKDYQAVILPLGYKPGSREIAAAVLCAPNPAQEWRKVMAGKSMAKPCEKGLAQVQRNMDAFEQLHLTGTPTMVTPGGLLVAGDASVDELRLVLTR